MKLFLNAAEVARLVRVDRATITRWIKKGELPAQRVGSSQWRVSFTAYEKLVQPKSHTTKVR